MRQQTFLGLSKQAADLVRPVSRVTDTRAKNSHRIMCSCPRPHTVPRTRGPLVHSHEELLSPSCRSGDWGSERGKFVLLGDNRGGGWKPGASLEHRTAAEPAEYVLGTSPAQTQTCRERAGGGGQVHTFLPPLVWGEFLQRDRWGRVGLTAIKITPSRLPRSCPFKDTQID